MSIHDPAPPAPAALPGWPLLRLGFRPFYLGAALLACVAIPLWIAAFLGHMPLRLPFPILLWHAHEMLFGFAAGVVIGFLLTAVRAWTGLETPRGPVLGVLVLLWLAARLAAVLAPYPVFAVLDMLLLPVVAGFLLRVLIRARNRRNIPLISLLLAMALANAVFHLSVLELIAVPAMSALYAELALILMVISIMTGRVVPMFTKNVTPGLVIQVSRRFELTLLAVTAVTLALWVLGAPAWLVLPASVLSAVLHALRLWKWHPRVTLRRPILWILHFSYAWMPVGFALLALAQLGWVAPSLAVHAFGVGVIGGLIIGMITRTARGHTGRP
ncbi:MAG TPA: NnrS family protein, partial [Ottowia sp.]|nr:NnrS family protein [Ottowia sp.]